MTLQNREKTFVGSVSCSVSCYLLNCNSHYGYFLETILMKARLKFLISQEQLD